MEQQAPYMYELCFIFKLDNLYLKQPPGYKTLT